MCVSFSQQVLLHSGRLHNSSGRLSLCKCWGFILILAFHTPLDSPRTRQRRAISHHLGNDCLEIKTLNVTGKTSSNWGRCFVCFFWLLFFCLFVVVACFLWVGESKDIEKAQCRPAPVHFNKIPLLYWGITCSRLISSALLGFVSGYLVKGANQLTGVKIIWADHSWWEMGSFFFPQRWGMELKSKFHPVKVKWVNMMMSSKLKKCKRWAFYLP